MKNKIILAIVSVILFAGLANANDPSLIAHWTFNEGIGTVAYDSANSNNGIIKGANWATGQIGNALNFNGSNGYVDMGDTVKYSLGTNYTISAWIKTDSLTSFHEIATYRDSVSEGSITPVLFQLDQSDSNIRFIVVDNSDDTVIATYSNILTANTWFHVAGVRSGNNLNVYVNGISGTPASGELDAISSDNLKVGALLTHGAPVDHFFDGIIDDVRIYNRALSAAEIQQLSVPEPASIAMLGIGALILRNRKKS